MDTNRTAPIAGWKHTTVLLIILGAIALRGAQFQAAAPAAVERHVLPLYVSLIVGELLLLYTVARGISRTGMTLVDLAGGLWPGARAVAKDVVIAAAIWLLVKLVAFGWDWLSPLPAQTRAINPLLPVGAMESALWIVVSITGGVTEEVVFRGYFQRQFSSFSKNEYVGIALQAIVFGASHGYQGLSACVKIALIGVVFGTAAKACRSLRPGMIAHVMTDILGGIARI